MDNGVEVKTPWLSLSGSGANVKFLLLVFLSVLLSITAYITYSHAEEQKQEQKQTVMELKETKQAIREMTYVLTLPQDKREKLRLDMPRSLRERINSRDE